MKNALKPLAIKFSSIFIVLISGLVLASQLSKEIFGFYSAVISAMLVSVTLSNMGLVFYTLDKIPKLSDTVSLRVYIKLNFTALSGAVVGGILFYFYVCYFLGVDEFTVCLLLIVFQNITLLNVSLFRATRNINSALMFENVIFYCVSCFLLILLLPKVDKGTILGVLLLSSAVSCFLSTFFLFRTIKFNGNSDVNISASNLRPFFFLSVAEVVTNQLDVVLVSAYFSLEDVASFYLAKKFIVLFSLFWYLFNYMYAPVISKIFIDFIQGRSKLKGILRKSRVILFLTLFLGVFSMLFYKQVFSFIGLPMYNNIGTYLVLFLIYTLIHIITGPVITILNVSGLAHHSARVVFVGGVIFGLSFYPLTKFFGIEGIIYASILSLISWKLYGVYLVSRILRFNIITGNYK